ncbi:hypothetical protein FOA43_000983 [Brettanomyces nanus]|uniref:Ribosomal RNA-processing protein 41 n=1 Tax=Eeniella nana TaxID=13502 RepID=A0A875RNH0_EENNA|nr:uncharacterized protein FOA43_000983 [Brettanomyces nanus]QPG73670.1 hypothetical protein FOA43_000983 [Brettanomyces nanus]
MSRFELYSPEGIRIDGRRWNELRQFHCQTNTHPNASDGSSYVRQGNSEVICLVKGPMDTTYGSSSTKQLPDSPVLSISINHPAFATMERKKRPRNDKRLTELSIILKRCFLKTIVLHNFARSLIEVTVTVLSFDGGLLATCCNAITLALIDAGISLYDYVSAVTVGLYDQTALLDLNSLEEIDLSFITIGVVGDSDKLNLILCEDRLPLDKLERLISLGIEGCHRLKGLMNDTVRQVGADLLSKKQ